MLRRGLLPVFAVAAVFATTPAIAEPIRVGDVAFEVVATIPVPRNPHGSAFSADGLRAYVACSADDVIAVIDTRTYEVIGRLDAGATPLDVMFEPGGGSLIVTQFRGDSLVRLPIAGGGAMEEVQRVGAGPSLFTPRAVRGGRRYVASEFADLLSEINADGTLRRSWPAVDRPYPPSVTRDGILVFTPLRDSDEIMVLDALNDRPAARVAVGARPEGGALTNDDVSYIAASGGANELAFINTATFEVETVVRDGVGPRPFSVTMTGDDRFAIINNAGGATLGVLDLESRTIAGEIPVGEIPIVVRAHPDGERFFVSCEGSHVVSVIRMTRAAPTPADAHAARKTRVLVLGMIHSGHRTSEKYSLETLRAIIRAYAPDDVCVEIPPNRLPTAMRQWRESRAITEPRTRVFPEYVDALFPLLDEFDFAVIPTAGWSSEMNEFRRAALRAIENDPARAAEWAEYRESMGRLSRELEALGAGDDPRVVNSREYDAAIRRAYGGPYNKYFNDDLDDGGWDNINRKHWGLIEGHLDRVRGGGRRVLVTFGGAHKYWFLERLAERDDVEIVDPMGVLDAAGVPARAQTAR